MLSHKYHGTPAQLIWDIRQKLFDKKNVIGLMRVYPRKLAKKVKKLDQSDEEFAKHWTSVGFDKKCENDDYYGEKGRQEQIYMNSADTFVKALENPTPILEGERKSTEVAFQGFHIMKDAGWGLTQKDTTHDLPKCDMMFTVDQYKSIAVQAALKEIKDYVGDLDIVLYKTTNSFHLYVASILNRQGISDWYKFLNDLNAKYPGVIDHKWLAYNSKGFYQPLRISETSIRGLPQLFTVL